MAPLAPRCPQPSGMSLSLLSGGVTSERPGAVKGAPLLGAAKRTLDGEDRSARLMRERKARRTTSERWSQKMAPSAAATDRPGTASTPRSRGQSTFEGSTVPLWSDHGRCWASSRKDSTRNQSFGLSTDLEQPRREACRRNLHVHRRAIGVNLTRLRLRPTRCIPGTLRIVDNPWSGAGRARN